MARLYSHFYRVTQDISGNIVPGVQGTITLADTATLATLYADPEGTTTLPNPLFNSTQYGSFSVYLDTGHYDMAFLKEGYIFEPLQDIQISEASGGVASLVGTPNRVLVSASTGDIVLNAPQDLHPDASLQFAHLGLGTPANGGLGLLVATGATFQAPINTVAITSSNIVTANGFTALDHAGNTQVGFWSYMNIAGGTNRWAFYGSGDAPAHFGGNVDTSGTLYVSGATTLNSTLTVSFGATVANLTSTGAVAATTNMSAGGTLTVNGDAAFGIAINPTYGLVTGGKPSLFNGVVYTVGGLQSSGHLHATTTAQVTGTLSVGGHITTSAGMILAGNFTTGGSVTAAYIDSTGGIHASGNLESGGTVFTNYIQTALESGFMRNASGGWAISAAGAIQTSVATATKLGAGPWGESSSRHLKRAIMDIPDPLGLLLGQRGRRYEWDEPERASLMPGPQHGFVYDEVTVEQWKDTGPDGEEILTIRGFEALAVEALRAIVTRLEALEGGGGREGVHGDPQ